ncbi:hypothetical protein JP75_20365 [Devosia riboflavina]|uniref:Uncharacterized protein n=1 Tax=Devosia riboflavina TaxID=46914 RepID=A0A087LY25_9HYPH|nr:hypothetical protein JP75_20365 [Devosia riboflavina]
MLTKNTADDVCFGVINPALAVCVVTGSVNAADYVIAIGQPAAGFPLLDAPAHAAVGLCRKVFQEQSIHRAFEADVEA